MAGVLGASLDRKEWFEGNGYYVTWCFGNLVGINAPVAKGTWELETLPLDPDHLELEPQSIDAQGTVPDPEVVRRLNIIRDLFNRSDSIIEATDAGREGENIFRKIYEYLDCKKPFRRLWANSLAESSLRKAFDNLQPGSDYDLKGLAARLREESDWRYGINATRASTLSAGTDNLLSAGRVQMAALKMICDRYNEFISFEPSPYWYINIEAVVNGVTVKWRSSENFVVLETARAVMEALRQDWQLKVMSFSESETRTLPPLLHNLGSLQKEANTKWGYPASRTEQAVQYLYERQFVSYPRTESRYISHDDFQTMPELIQQLETHPDYGKVAKAIMRRGLSTRCVNDDKCVEHTPLLITERKPGKLDEVEARIYDLILSRFLEAFCPDSLASVAHASAIGADRLFLARGRRETFVGWRCVKKASNDLSDAEKEEEQGQAGEGEVGMIDGEVKEDNGAPVNVPQTVALPKMELDEIIQIEKMDLVRDETKPRPELSDATLLSLMEGSGRTSGCGIGTAATRACEIDILVERGYVKREEKSRKLVPTRLGMDFYKAMSETDLCDISLTERWETLLRSVEEGIIPPTLVKDKVRAGVKRLIQEILVEGRFDELKKNNPPLTAVCPDCGNTVRVTSRGVRCDKCGFHMYANKAGLNLSRETMIQLLQEGRTDKIKGFKRKNGTAFEAVLVLEKGGKASFLSDVAQGPKPTDIRCPRCGTEMTAGDRSVYCSSCHLSFYLEAFGARLSVDEVARLIETGQVTPSEPFRKKDGSGTYRAALRLDGDWRYALSFDEKAIPSTLVICQRCGHIMQWGPKDLKCQCGFTVRRKAFGRDLSDDEVAQLAEKGRVGPLGGFVSSKGKPYVASIVVDAEGNTKLEFND